MTTVDFDQIVTFSDKQKAFFEATADHKYTLYGGLKGGGKSFVIRWWLLSLAMNWGLQGHKGVRVGLFTESYRTLREMHVSKMKSEFPKWMGEYSERDEEFRLSEHLGGGIIACRNLDEPTKYNGVEFAAIGVDELAKNTEDVFHQLRSCLRWPNISKTRFAGGTNPEGAGLAWVRKLWIERDFSPPHERLNPDDFAFIEAGATDNPNLDAGYYDLLQSLPEAKRRAYLEGDWYVFEGQFFDEWREQLHVVKPFEIPDEWRRWRAVDFGTNAPYCCLWLAQDPATGRRYVYRERYRRGLTATRQAEDIVEATGNEEIAFTVADPAMFNKTNDDGTAPADSYRESGVVLRRGFNNRLAGWNNIRESLQLMPDGKPGLQVFSTCRNLIRTLPALVYDDNKPEDCDTTQEDHAPDALRYGLGPSGALLTVRGTIHRLSKFVRAS